MTDSPATTAALDTEFTRGLGLYDSTMVVVGSMIGSGIFIVSADMARTIGSPGWLLAAWVLTGALTIVGALSYGELAAMMPRAGGQYVYLREAFSPLWRSRFHASSVCWFPRFLPPHGLFHRSIFRPSTPSVSPRSN